MSEYVRVLIIYHYVWVSLIFELLFRARAMITCKGATCERLATELQVTPTCVLSWHWAGLCAHSQLTLSILCATHHVLLSNNLSVHISCLKNCAAVMERCIYVIHVVMGSCRKTYQFDYCMPCDLLAKNYMYIDIDECLTGSHNCFGFSNCINNDGSFTCTCPHGYALDANGFSCTGHYFGIVMYYHV